MANTFTLKRSSVARKIPTAAQLSTGELAVNLVDGKLYTENASGAVLTLAESPHELITASEALLAGDWVNVYNNAGTANVRKASASDSTRPMTGFVLEDTAVAALAKVYFSGTNDAVAGLTVGTQYLSTTAGQSTATAPASNVQIVGTSVSPTRVRMLDAGVVQPSVGGGTGGGTATPEGASGAVQFNNAGAFAGAALTTVNVDGQLNLLPGGFSSNPASGGILGMLSAAQYGVPAFEGMTGAPFALGQHLGLGRRFGLARANAGSALVPNLIGFPAATTTGSTLTTRLPTPSPVNAYAQRSARIGLVSAATAGSIAQYWFNPNPNFTAGNGNILGGFLACFRFVCSDAAVVSGARMFIGMQSGVAAPVNVEPNTLTVSIGLAQLSTSSNAHIVCGSALPAIDLGANFPLSGQSDSLYDLILYLPPSSPTTAYYEVRRYTTSVTAPFIATGTLNTGFPNTTQLGPRIWRTNNATALAVGLDLCHIYVEDASL